ncbi:protein IQ-DOMAIN 1 isoform X2 [Phoenix dactylifera]|uniref:Protein IQ-DOMAIN 1 isoform X2 n=1 Tax=Phoenix dactylifera TaxID=42345 RepID=A0A8B7BHJ9_PHODC|nr:protein IQ-DOMAIN 1 isoform X2 [Phoenix dactylifera]
MGLSGGLVRRVFLKTRSSSSIRNSNERNFGVDKTRWCSVRHYLCGDEFNSSPAEDDLSSVEGSEATATQHLIETSRDEESPPGFQLEEHEEASTKEGNPPATLLSPEDAAVFIQSAFRGFMARQLYEEIRKSCEGDHIEGSENPSGASAAASTEAQVGDSVKNLSLQEKSVIIPHKVQHKAQTQVYRVKEKWDNSTVSSNVLKLKIQNRLEATTRRERALAYAFSQQLRTCSAKKKSTQSDSKEPNMGWSWLERWMATRMPENSLAEDCLNKHFDSISTYQRSAMIKKRLDVAIEEKESCGSNDVSVNFDSSTTPQTPRDGYRPVKSRKKATRSMLRRRTVLDYNYMTRSSKVSKRDSLKEVEKEKRCKQVQPKNKVELHAEASQVPSDYWMNSCI